MSDDSDRIIYVLVAVLVLFGGMSFFVSPSYEKGTWLIIGAVVSGLGGMFGFKFGVHIPKPESPVPNEPAAEPQKENQK